MRTVAIAIAILLLSATRALAWGDDGHMAVCHIAYQMLTPTARAEVDRLLALDGEYDNWPDACTDEDNAPRPRPDEHFLNLPRNKLSVDDDNCFASSKCVITAIKGDWGILRSSAPDLDRAHALKSLGHWLGDIHQPLHISFADDRGGNKITNSGTCSSGDLHAVWDTCIPDSQVFHFTADEHLSQKARRAKLFAGADELASDITSAQKAAWITSTPEAWAAESYRVALQPDVRYCVMKHSSCWYGPTQHFYSGGSKRSVMITSAYLTQYGPVVKERLSQAAVRLAYVLNSSLDPAYVAPHS